MMKYLTDLLGISKLSKLENMALGRTMSYEIKLYSLAKSSSGKAATSMGNEVPPGVSGNKGTW